MGRPSDFRKSGRSRRARDAVALPAGRCGDLANWKAGISRVGAAATVETLLELQRLLFGFQLNRRHQLRSSFAVVDPLADSMRAHPSDGYEAMKAVACWGAGQPGIHGFRRQDERHALLHVVNVRRSSSPAS